MRAEVAEIGSLPYRIKFPFSLPGYIKGYLRMITKRSSDLLIALGIMVLGLLAMQALAISRNGRVCNYGSTGIWLTVTESGRQKAYSLAPGHCTDILTQDVEAIWGRDCNTDPCNYQAWKVGAGRFEVDNDGASPLGSVLRIKGWGVGSRWRISRAWLKPDLSTINYSLVR
jgi:hypothetical protein